MFEFCTEKLQLSEGEVFRRLNAARLARRFPVIFELLETGAIHLSALVLLRDHLTDDNHLELLREPAGKKKPELQALLAARFPKPDVASSIRKLPARKVSPGADRPALEFSGSADKTSDGSAERLGRGEPLSPVT